MAVKDSAEQQLQTQAEAGTASARSLIRSRLSLFLRIGVAVVLIVVILSWIDFNTVVQTLARANLWLVMLLFPLSVLDRFLMAFKWAALLRTRGVHITNWEALRIYMASTFVGTVLPTGVGSDVFRAVRTTMGGPKMNVVTASIVLERILGILGLASLAFIGLGILSIQPNAEIRVLFLAVAGFLAVVLAGMILSIHPRTYTVITRLLSRFEHLKLVRLFMKFHGAYMDMSRHRKVLVMFVLLSIVEQGIGSVTSWIGAMALGFTTPLIYFLALLPLSRFVTLLPISIGGIGLTEGTYVVIFSLAGLSPADALSLALLIRVAHWIMLVPSGLIFLYDSARFKRAQDPVTG